MNSFPDIRPAVWSPPAPPATLEPTQHQEELAIGLLKLASADDLTKSRMRELIAATERHDEVAAKANKAQLAAEKEREAADARIAEAKRGADDLAVHVELHRKRHNELDGALREGQAKLAQERKEIEAARATLAKDQAAYGRMLTRLRDFLTEAEAPNGR